MHAPDTDTQPDPIPFPALMLILLWIGLLGGRWLLPQPMLWLGFLTPTQLMDLDQRVLQPLYIFLLIVTPIVAFVAFLRQDARGSSDLASFPFFPPDRRQNSPQARSTDEEIEAP